MRFCAAIAILLLLCGSVRAQDKGKHAPPVEGKVVTVPAIIDHNRVIIEVGVPTQNGTVERVLAWIDTGGPDLFESAHVAMVSGRRITCVGPCWAQAPAGIAIGDMDVSFDGVKDAYYPPWEIGHQVGTMVIPGVNAEMNLPSSVLRHYDLLVDFPGRKVTIGTPGSIHFNGVSAKVQINPDTGVITVPSKIDNKKYDLELDLGSPLSSLSADLFDALAAAHPDWPRMTGPVGPANDGGGDQLKRRVMRLDRLQFGPLFLTNMAVGDWAKERANLPGKLGDAAGVGLLGSQALLNYRVGIDYAHSTIYFDIGRLFNFPDFDVIGLVLQPEDNSRFTILGVADFDGKPSVPLGPEGVQSGDHLVAIDDIPAQGLTMGQVWSMLGGTPGQDRRLTIEREGKQFVVKGTVMHFLAEPPDDSDTKKKK